MKIEDLKIDNMPATYIAGFVKHILKASQSLTATAEKLSDTEYLFNVDNQYLLAERRGKNFYAICTFIVTDIITTDVDRPFTLMIREKIRTSDIAKVNPEKFETLQKASFSELQFFKAGQSLDKIVKDNCNIIDDEYCRAAELVRKSSKNVSSYRDIMNAQDLIESPEVKNLIHNLNSMPATVRRKIVQRLI